MKKLLFFLESLHGGGAEKILADIVQGLDREKYDISVYTVVDEGVYQDKVSACAQYHAFLKQADFRAGGLKKAIYRGRMKLIYTLPAGWIYRRYVRERYDVEIGFIEGYATKFIAASSNKQSRKIAWVHTDMIANNYAQSQYASHKAQEQCYRKYDKICCVSGDVGEAFGNKFFSDEKVSVCYNPIDREEISRKAKEEVAMPRRAGLHLVTVGRLEEQKGYIRLATCLGRLRREGYTFSLWLIGEGSQRPAVEALIEKYDLRESVVLLGFQENPYKYMSKCDAFVCSSYAEGFSTAATEALVLGKPVFTTACAGMRELFGDEKCGEIVPNTEEELYALLKSLVSEERRPEAYKDAVNRRARALEQAAGLSRIEALLDE